MDDRILAMCELSNDLLFHKIPQDQYGYYINRALEAGRQAALAFQGQDIRQLYAQNGITIHISQNGRQSYGVILRGQVTMSKTECSVEVYQESIQELARHSDWNGQTLTGEQALEVHLAHEFFHFWEYKGGSSIVDALRPVTTLKFLGYERKAHINRCGEVAAHSFAKTLLGLPVLPNLYDYFYLVNTGKMTREQLGALTKRMEALLKGAEA